MNSPTEPCVMRQHDLENTSSQRNLVHRDIINNVAYVGNVVGNGVACQIFKDI